MKKIVKAKKKAVKKPIRRIIKPKVKDTCSGRTTIQTGTGQVNLLSPLPSAALKARARALAEKDLNAKLERMCKLRSRGCRCGLIKQNITAPPVFKTKRLSPTRFVLVCTVKGYGWCGCT